LLFAGTVEVGLYIVEDTVEGAGVGKYLHSSTVKIIDTSAFPDDPLRQWVTGGKPDKVAEVSAGTLIRYFVKFCTDNRVCWAGTKKAIMLHQYQSLVGILNIFVMYFFIQALTSDELSDKEKSAELSVMGVLWVAPFCFVHYLSYRKNFWKVGGSIKKQLYGLIFKKFLNYDDTSRSQISTDKIVMTLTRDVNTAVSNGYITTVDLLFGSVPNILYLLASIVWLQLQSANGLDPVPLIAASALVPAVAFILVARQAGTFAGLTQFSTAENACISYVIKSIINYQLVADYDRRTSTEQVFDCQRSYPSWNIHALGSIHVCRPWTRRSTP